MRNKSTSVSLITILEGFMRKSIYLLSCLIQYFTFQLMIWDIGAEKAFQASSHERNFIRSYLSITVLSKVQARGMVTKWFALTKVRISIFLI